MQEYKRLDVDKKSVFFAIFTFLIVGFVLYKIDITLLWLIAWLPYFYLIEIPLHEGIHYTAGKILKEDCKIDLKYRILNSIWGIKRYPAAPKPKTPYCIITKKITAYKIIVFSLAPLVVFTALWLSLLWLTNQKQFLFLLTASVVTSFGDLSYSLFAIINRKKEVLFEDLGSVLIAWKK